jgi:hypothetical protein
MFWIGYIIIATLLFALFAPPKWALLRTLSIASIHILLVYFHLKVLLPRYFDTRKFGWYAFLLIVALAIATWLKIEADQLLLNFSELEGPLAQYREGKVPVLSGLVANLVFLFITTPVRWMDELYKRKELQQQFQTHRLEAELRFLKTQVNPHFLFNTLNNLYSLAYIGSEQTAPTILKLSEMMRYMLYESDAEYVPLEKEIQYLNNFIQLQELKTEESQQIVFEVIGEVAGIQIPPLLFVPLFENAFKHGNLDEGGWLKSKLIIQDTVLDFNITNSFLLNQKKDQIGGIGLENVKKRLELLFPENHEFLIEQKDQVFSVKMKCVLEN